MNKITVGDLKNVIAGLPDETLVMVDGYEGGVLSPVDMKLVKVYPDENPTNYTGDHELLEPGEQHVDAFTVFYLGR